MKTKELNFTPGTLVSLRDRDWIVLPSPTKDLILLKPLNGTETETIGIFKPLQFPNDQIQSAEFPIPSPKDAGTITSASLLYNATRLSFRNGAGPFRSLAKYSFRPRAYQMVPLIMALKQQTVRLLIADDVGIGKTIEALMIIKELLERREIKRFAIICLPHLCEQWQAELKDKMGLEAVIIRSNTQAKLDREIHNDQSVFEFYPFQVISIDYIKAENRAKQFNHFSPELIVVDEAHTCSKPSSTKKSQHQRYNLIKALALKPEKHLVLLTATPHSGKPEQFQSLIGLLNPEFQHIDLTQADKKTRRTLAKHFIQRRRGDVKRYLKEDTLFPQRIADEQPYELHPEYFALYNETRKLAQELMKKDPNQNQKTLRYWTALSLLRTIMSSPAAGIQTLKNRIQHEIKHQDENHLPTLEYDHGFEGDHEPTQFIQEKQWSNDQIRKLQAIAAKLEQLKNPLKDQKVHKTIQILKKWNKQQFQPLIFCKFIATAKYLGEQLILAQQQKKLPKSLNIQVITSEDPPEVRKERIHELGKSPKRILIATDCLSEGINLQQHFTAVLHYDLPWNPNRLEQREGRVDRFGQPASTIKTTLLYGKDNPIDGIVLEIILKKVQEIRKSIGISIPFPENSKSIMDAILKAVIHNPIRIEKDMQLSLFIQENKDVKEANQKASLAMKAAVQREKASRSIFAQSAIKAQEIEQDLKQTDDAIGNPQDLEQFITQAIPTLGGIISPTKEPQAYTLQPANLPQPLKNLLPNPNQITQISFQSPTPQGHTYLGRNHPFVAQLCQYIMATALEPQNKHNIARASIIRTDAVKTRTALYIFRVRNVIEAKKTKTKIVAEEMLLWGYSGIPSKTTNTPNTNPTIKTLSPQQVQHLINTAKSTEPIHPNFQRKTLQREHKRIPILQPAFDQIAKQRAQTLVDAHERFRKTMGGNQYQIVIPILPMDIIAIHILLPQTPNINPTTT